MFMQSFKNSDTQQKRRTERQLAMQRMQEAARMDGISMVSMSSSPERGEGQTKQEPSTEQEGRVSQMVMDIVANPTTAGHDGSSSHMLQRGYHTHNSTGVASNGSRFSLEKHTAQKFLWDDGSLVSGTSRVSSTNVNLHDIKNSLQTKSTNKWSRHKSSRWSAINNYADNHEPVPERSWNALSSPFGRRQITSDCDIASVKSSTSSKYRDKEGERLLGMAAQRLRKVEAVTLNTSREENEYGANCSDCEDDDEETEIRHRVILDRDGNLTYDNNDYGDLHARRINNHYRRSLKRPLVCLLAISCCIGIVTTLGVLITQRFTTSGEKQSVTSSHDQGTSLQGSANHDTWHKTNELPNSERFEAIKTQLLRLRVTHPSALDDMNSAQHAALKWIADDDPRRLDPSNEYLAQRYGLVTLWFSTTETEYKWHIPAEYAQDEDNNNRVRKLTSNNGTSIWTRHENWLTDKGICQWEGVVCDSDKNASISESDGQVSRIQLKNNNMHGLICKEIYTTLPHLTHMDLSNNGFTGILSPDIGLWNELTYLNFTGNRLGGSIVKEIGKLSQLKVLHFANNFIGNTIPDTLADLAKLRDLDLSENELTGTIPSEIGQLEDLISLNLSYNQLEGDIPHEFSKLNLVTFDVGSNRLEGSLGTEIGLMSHLEVLRLNDNNLSGNIPSELGQLVHLNELHMKNNDFTGNLPSELSGLTSLESLKLADNQLEGEIPVELTELSGLQRLDLSNNKFKGPVPRLIYNMKDLTELNLAKNSFTGSIPPLIGNLFKLESIELYTNEFEGEIPSQLGELTKLKKLALHNNNLTGTVSPQLCKLVDERFLSLISADCAGESAYIDCSCCQCHSHENVIHVGGV